MELETETSACLTSTPFIDVNHSSIVSTVERMGVADMYPPARAAALFRFVRDEILYEFMAKLAPEDYVASHILRVGRGFSVQKAELLAALGRAAGVPTALVLSDLRFHARFDELPFAQMIAAFVAAYGQAAFPVLARYGSGSRGDV